MAANDVSRRAFDIARGLQDDANKLGLGPRTTGRKSTKPLRDDNAQSSPPRVFVSWAHKGESWTSGETQEWASEVVEFTGMLRANGIDADLDLFHTHETEIDWTRFGPQQVDGARYVVIAMSEAWAQRWSGTNHPKVGAGAVGEADALKGLFQEDQIAWQRKVLIVILPSQESAVLPHDLARINRFWVDPDDPDTLDPLLRSMTAQPLYEKPALGEVPVLPPGIAKTLKRPKSDDVSTEYGDYAAVLGEVKKEQSAAKKGAVPSDRLFVLMALLDALSS